MAVDTRDGLLDAAERAILDQGFSGASTRRIAAEAGVPLSLLHYHFGGKEGLLVALVERTRDRNRVAVLAELADPSSATGHAAAALLAAKRVFLTDETGARLLVEMAVAALHNARLRAEMSRLYIDTMAMLKRAVATLPDERNQEERRYSSAEALASLILAAGLGLGLQRMLGVQAEAVDSAFDALAALLLRPATVA